MIALHKSSSSTNPKWPVVAQVAQTLNAIRGRNAVRGHNAVGDCFTILAVVYLVAFSNLPGIVCQ